VEAVEVAVAVMELEMEAAREAVAVRMRVDVGRQLPLSPANEFKGKPDILTKQFIRKSSIYVHSVYSY
jgi:hypothetical protein